VFLRPDLAEAYLGRGTEYYRKGDIDQAMADYTEAIRLSPNYAKAYYNRGGAYADTGDFDKSFAEYNEAARLNSCNT
jgi:tetratricopeptide (TPR) repeat protein